VVFVWCNHCYGSDIYSEDCRNVLGKNNNKEEKVNENFKFKK